MHGLALVPGSREGLLVGADDFQLHQARLRRDRQHRYSRLRRLRREVLEQDQGQTVRKVGRQLEAFLDHLLLAVLVGVADLDLAAQRVDGRFHRHLERWTLLHKVIADQAELLSLRVDCGLVPRRAVLETEDEPCRHAFPLGSLDQVAGAQPARGGVGTGPPRVCAARAFAARAFAARAFAAPPPRQRRRRGQRWRRRRTTL